MLNRALKHELAAINQYWLHYRLLDDWGFTLLAKKEREESIEEMHHADKLVTRIIFLEGHPNLQTLDSLRIGQTIKEVLECDLAAEYSARALYKQPVSSAATRATTSRWTSYEDLLEDEEGHIDSSSRRISSFSSRSASRITASSSRSGERAGLSPPGRFLRPSSSLAE